MRFPIAPALILATFAYGCHRDKKSEVSDDNDEFLGPIPSDYRNTLTADELRAAASTEGDKIDQAVAQFGFEAPSFLLRGQTGADPTFPDLDRCENLTSVSGGFLIPRDIKVADSTPDLLKLVTLSCASISRALNGSFADLTLALDASLRNAASFNMTQDSCTAPVVLSSLSSRSAVGFALVRRSEGDGLYLNDYKVSDLSASAEAGGDGQTLALRNVTDLRASGDLQGNLSLDQNVVVASVIDVASSHVESQKRETMTVRDQLNGALQTTGLERLVTVRFNYGPQPMLSESTEFTRTHADGTIEKWQLDIDAAAAKPGVVSLKIRVNSDSKELSTTMTCGDS